MFSLRVATIIALLAVVSCSTDSKPQKLSKSERMVIQGEALYKMFADPETGVIPDGINSAQNHFLAERFSKKRTDVTAQNTWENVGPNELGGRTRTLTIDVSNEDHVLVGGVSGGIWSSVDQGRSWQKTILPSALQTITCIAQDTRPGHTNTWYATTGEPIGDYENLMSGDGVLKSTDNGASWILLESTASHMPHIVDSPFDHSWRVVVDPTSDNGTVYVATHGHGIWRSDDGGSTWLGVLGDDSNGNIAGHSDICVSTTGDLYAVVATETATGFFASEDGLEWENITPAWLTPFDLGRAVIQYSDASNELYVFSNSERHGHEYPWGGRPALFVRTANGEWENRSQNLPSGEGVRRIETQDGWCIALSVHPTKPEYVYVGGISLFRSSDGFRTPDNVDWVAGMAADLPRFDLQFYPGNHPDQHAIVYVPSDPDKAYNLHDGGVSFTADVCAEIVEWEHRNTSYMTTQIYDVGLFAEGEKRFLAAGPQDHNVHMTTNIESSDAWTEVNAFGDGIYAEFSKDGSSRYAARQFGQAYRFSLSEQGAIETYTAVSPPGWLTSNWLSAFALDPFTDSIVYFGTGIEDPGVSYLPNVYALPDKQMYPQGEFWETALVSEGSITDIAVVDNNGERLLYATNERGDIHRIERPLSNENTSRTYFHQAGFISSLTVDPEDPNHIFFSYSNYGVISIWESFDGGENAHSVAGNLEEFIDGSGSGPGVLNVDFIRTNEQELLVCATSKGLFATAFINGPNTAWQPIAQEEIGRAMCFDIEYEASHDWLVVGVYGLGVWSSTAPALDEVSVATPQLELPIQDEQWVDASTTFSWDVTPGALTYELQLSTSSDFQTIHTSIKGISGLSAVLNKSFSAGQQMFWRVRGYNATSQGEWSEIREFYSIPNIHQHQPPNRSDTTLGRPVTCSWQMVEGAQSYNIEVSKFPSLLIKDIEVAGIASTSYELGDLDPNQTYYWRVSAVGPREVETESEIWTFKTSSENSVSSTELTQLFVAPIPAADEVNIRLANDMMLEADFEFEIYNAQGRIVRAPVSVYSNNVVVETRSLSSGSYVVIVKEGAGDAIATANFVVQK